MISRAESWICEYVPRKGIFCAGLRHMVPPAPVGGTLYARRFFIRFWKREGFPQRLERRAPRWGYLLTAQKVPKRAAAGFASANHRGGKARRLARRACALQMFRDAACGCGLRSVLCVKTPSSRNGNQFRPKSALRRITRRFSAAGATNKGQPRPNVPCGASRAALLLRGHPGGCRVK